MTTNQTINGVPRELLERLLEVSGTIDYARAQHELRALLDADKVNTRQLGLMQFVEAHPIKPSDQPRPAPVAAAHTCCGSCPAGCVIGAKP